MSDEKYYLIYNSDGDTFVCEMTEENIQKHLDEQLECKEERRAGFLDGISNNDTNYWGNNELIIKGKIVTPKAKAVVTKMEIE